MMKTILLPFSIISLLLSTARTFILSSNSRSTLNLWKKSHVTAKTKNLQHLRTSNSRRRTCCRLSVLLMTSSMATMSNSTRLANGGDNDNPASNGILVQPFPESLLEHDHYNGVTVRLDHVEKTENSLQFLEDPDDFARCFKAALEIWKAEGRKGVWIHVPDQWASVVPKCVECGFRFHFCHSGVLVLSKWLPQTKSRLPFGPTHQAGIGALVLNPEDPSKMLVVQEVTGPAAARQLWKMPTGLLDPFEDIHIAAERELLEETGLTGKFEGILCFRQAHNVRGTGRPTSDLFFICLMKLQSSSELENLKLQEEEIKDIKWMPVDEYAGQELWQGSPVYKELNKAAVEAIKNNSFMTHKTLPLGFSKGTNSIYRSNI